MLVAHGTNDPAGQATVIQLRELVAGLLPGVTVYDAYVDVQQPALDEVVDSLVQQRVSTVIVPLLLSTGYHVEVDIERCVASSPLVTAAPALGPHPVLAEILADRLRGAGIAPDLPVVLAAAGSSRPGGVAAVHAQAELLQALRTGPVTAAFLSAAAPSVQEAASDGAAVATYLLGRGVFDSRLRELAARATEPIGADPRLAEIVRERYLRVVTPAAD